MRLDYDGIAYDLRSDSDTVFSVINDFDLFVFDVNTFGSLSVQKRLDERNDKSIKARESANKRWNNANALQPQSDSNAIKERKGKEIKETKYRDNISLLEKEKIKLDLEFGEDTVQKCFDFLSSYKVEKSYKTKSDYLTIKRWVVDAVKKPIQTSSSKIGNKYQNELETARNAFKPI